MAVNTISKTVYAAHSAEQMFELVDRVEDYPRFLPWYGRTEVLSRQGNELRARLHMDYMGMRQSFATRNTNVPGRESRMELLEGPFQSRFQAAIRAGRPAQPADQSGIWRRVQPPGRSLCAGSRPPLCLKSKLPTAPPMPKCCTA